MRQCSSKVNTNALGKREPIRLEDTKVEGDIVIAQNSKLRRSTRINMKLKASPSHGYSEVLQGLIEEHEKSCLKSDYAKAMDIRFIID